MTTELRTPVLRCLCGDPAVIDDYCEACAADLMAREPEDDCICYSACDCRDCAAAMARQRDKHRVTH